MGYDQTEIAEKSQRVAVLLKGYVPSKGEAPAPELAPAFEEKRGEEFIAGVTPSVALPVNVAAAQEPAEIPVEEIGTALPDNQLRNIHQTPKTEPGSKQNAGATGRGAPEPLGAELVSAGAAMTASPAAPSPLKPTAAAGAASGSAYQHVDSDFVGAVHERAVEDNRRDFFLTQNTFEDGGETVGSGRRAHGNLANAIAQKEIQRRKERDADAYRKALKEQLDAINERIAALEERNREIDREIATNMRRIEKIDERLREIERQQKALKQYTDHLEQGGAAELDGKGRLKNKDAEKALQDYEKRTGQNIDRTDSDAVLFALRQQQAALEAERQALAQEKDDLNAKNDALKEERDENVAKIEEWSRQRDQILASDLSDDQKAQELEKLTQKAEASWDKTTDIRLDMLALQAEDGIDDRSELQEHMERKEEALSIDEEIEGFMREFAEVQKIDDATERLAREKSLVDKLSGDAKENLSWEASTEHLFTEGYFDALAMKRADAAPAASPGPSPT